MEILKTPEMLHGRDAHYGLHLQLPHQEISSSLSLHDNPRGPKDAHYGRGAHYGLPPHLPLQQIFWLEPLLPSQWTTNKSKNNIAGPHHKFSLNIKFYREHLHVVLLHWLSSTNAAPSPVWWFLYGPKNECTLNSEWSHEASSRLADIINCFRL